MWYYFFKIQAIHLFFVNLFSLMQLDSQRSFFDRYWISWRKEKIGVFNEFALFVTPIFTFSFCFGQL